MIKFDPQNTAECLDILSQMNQYVDGELAAEICHDLEQHLSECQDCQVVFDTLAKTVKLYRSLHDTPLEMPTGVEERLLKRLNLN